MKCRRWVASDKALHIVYYCCMYKKMDTARSILSSSASAVVPPEKFHPNKSFPFPKRSFGSKGEARSFRPEWCEKYSWLHYDAGTDAAFCFICMKTETEKKFKSSTKREATFISKGYTNWKDACEAFKKHSNSECHKEAVESVGLPVKTGDVGEMPSTEHRKEKEANRTIVPTL